MMQVNVQMLSGPLPPIDVPVDATVGDLKQRVQSLNPKYQIQQQKLLLLDFEHGELMNGRKLQSYDISRDTIITLVIAERPKNSVPRFIIRPNDPEHIIWLQNNPAGEITVRTDDISGNEDMLLNLVQRNVSIHTLVIDGYWQQEHVLFCKNLMALRNDIDIKYIFREFSSMVIKILEFCKTFERGHSKIELTGCYLSTEADCIGLSLALQSVSSLKKLSLRRNKIVESGVIALAPALKSMSSLQVLDMEHNYIGDTVGCTALAAALPSMTSLLSVNFGTNKLKGTGCAKVVTALAQILTLHELYLSDNEIGDVGCVVLAPALRLMTSLRVLELSHNQITDEGFKDLEATLVTLSHASLDSLRLEGNNFSVSHCRRVLQSIPHMVL